MIIIILSYSVIHIVETVEPLQSLSETCETSWAPLLHTCTLTQSKPRPNSKPPGARTNKNKYTVLKAVTVHTQAPECLLAAQAYTFIHNTSLCAFEEVYRPERRKKPGNINLYLSSAALASNCINFCRRHFFELHQNLQVKLAATNVKF